MKDIQNGSCVQNIFDLVFKKTFGIYKTEEQIKNIK